MGCRKPSNQKKSKKKNAAFCSKLQEQTWAVMHTYRLWYFKPGMIKKETISTVLWPERLRRTFTTTIYICSYRFENILIYDVTFLFFDGTYTFLPIDHDIGALTLSLSLFRLSLSFFLSISPISPKNVSLSKLHRCHIEWVFPPPFAPGDETNVGLPDATSS
jgi:hypothetical protein